MMCSQEIGWSDKQAGAVVAGFGCGLFFRIVPVLLIKKN
ncbi:hypothetical protein DLM_2063 [Aquitalea magnusonii]|jgi:hypothetical protein|uniref:Uncharacterized protein n=1 Tax=Aquitalea magnusonii TaxID=332411 RepID=A0A3G9GGC1_9NEIS|nr:hypothetical protein DLM_2063 [Aquitalea magnusonii]